MLALFSVVGVATPNTYDYTHAYDTTDNTSEQNNIKVKVTITNKNTQGVSVQNLNEDSDQKVYTLDDKYLIPKSALGHELVLFNDTDPNYSDIESLKNKRNRFTFEDNNPNQTLNLNVSRGFTANNVPMFIYIYDTVTQQLHKIYKEDGTRATYRKIVSEDVSGATTEGKLQNGTFEVGNGYIEANDLYKLMIGEIRDLDPNRNSTNVDDTNYLATDRARYGVSGKTLYDYLNTQKQNANLENPTDSLISDTKVKAYIDQEINKIYKELYNLIKSNEKNK